jgi:acyl-CoA thioesterase FadM
VALGVREIIVHTQIAEVGRASVRFEQTIVTPDGELAAEAEAVLVAWNPETRRSREITPAERQRLTAP